MKQLKPSNFEDIVAGISLYRPGPMDSIPTYIENKHNPDKITYIHESLRPIMEVSYGCLVYQEQVMQVVRDLAGYSYGRSDLVRRAMGKKKMDVMEQERQYFIHGKEDENGNIEIQGCVRNGVPEDIANKIFDDMIDFAKYAFNKSHAAAYGVVSYETAYLKAYYPVEFMAALITSVMGNTDKVVEYIRECSALDIEILKPDINKSFGKFSVEGHNIRFGLAAVKNVGVNVINNIIKERELNGDFKDFADLVKRLDSKDLNKRVLESLIKCGAFDNISDNRASLMMGYEKLLDSVSMDRKKNVKGQISLFDGFQMGKETVEVQQEISSIPKINEFEERERLAMEKEVLGMYVSGHPLGEYEEELKNNTSIDNGKINVLKEDMESYLNLDEKEVILGGMIVNKRIQTTKRNDIMAFLELEDLYGTIEVIVFPQTLKEYNSILNEDSIVYIKGKLSIKEEESAKLIAREIKDINDKSSFKSNNYNNSYAKNKKQSSSGIFVKIDTIDNQQLINSIEKILIQYKGNDDIYVCTEQPRRMFKWNSMKVNLNSPLEIKLQELLGKENVKVKI